MAWRAFLGGRHRESAPGTGCTSASMNSEPCSLEELLRRSRHALVVGVGGGGDVVGALAAARFLELMGLTFTLGGLSWERLVHDPVPGPRKLSEVRNVAVLHPYAWMANRE